MKNVFKRGISLAVALSLVVSATFSDVRVHAASSSQTKEETKKIQVWDFGGVQESNTSLYQNNIQAADWNTIPNVGSNGKFVMSEGDTTLQLGELSLFYTANDRLYVNSEESEKSVDRAWGQSAVSFADGYTSAGCYYCNGTGSETTRYFTVNNVNAGDVITVYMGATNSSESNLVCQYLGEEGTQRVETPFNGTKQKYEFIAEHSGSYKICTLGAGGGKPVYYRIMKTPAVAMTGTIQFGDIAANDYIVNFVNNETGAVTKATVTGTSFTVSLAPGYTYTAVLSGMEGVGFTTDCKVVAPTTSEIQTGKVVALTAEKKTLYDYSGSLKGFEEGTDTSKLQVTLEPDKDSKVDAVNVTIKEDGTFTTKVEPNVNYTVILAGVNDYEVKENKVINVTASLNQDIVVGKKAMYQVSGKLTGLANGTTATKLVFTNVEDEYTYEVAVSELAFATSLRDGVYTVTADAEGFATRTHIVVNGKDVTKDLLFASTNTTVQPMDRVSDIYVGDASKDHNYKTVTEAVAACKAMNPQSEEERITVHIAPGTYREQIMIDTPYISFVNDTPEKEVKLTWYYGIGYKYYSVDETGFYNPETAYDQYEKTTPAKWGAATYIKSKAVGFTAKDITFESSFNRYVTEEEIKDGVEITGGESITFKRELGADVASKRATERASAICIEGTDTQFINCSFLSSQDTVYTGGADTRSYFKDCFIEGNTDYIFGDGNVVFDQCTLNWYGYTENSAAGYITAARNNLAQHGYLFKDCKVTKNNKEGVTVTPGYFGRPWGETAKVAFINTELQDASLINEVGWTSMSNVTPEQATYVEYNTVLADGTKADTSKRIAGTVITDASAYTIANYLGDFIKEDTPADEKATIWVVGDSTVSAFNDNYYYPRYGWGTQLGNYFDSSKFEVKNIALSGRSSKSYVLDKEYQTLLDGMKKGDYLFIGFGHNDEKAEPERFTNPNGDYLTEGSFANSLYKNYIEPATNAGCTPILVTPIVRRTASGTFSQSELHITTTSDDGKGNVYEGGDYPEAIRTLGSTLSIPVVDMTKFTKEHYDALGAAGTVYLHAWTSNKETSVDNTHTNIFGATYNGYLIAKEVKNLGVKGLADAVIADKIASAPTKEQYLQPNPDYIVPVYDNNLKQSELWKDHGIWKGTIFGDIGGNFVDADGNKTNVESNYFVGTDADGNMNISVKNNKGKISGNTDGVAMYYYKVPVGSTFTLTATAKVNDVLNTNDQVSFGLMARDDMYIDTYNNTTLGDYVAAGPLKMKTAQWNCFARKSGVLTSGGTAVNKVQPGDTVDLKIESNSDGYACTLGNEQTVTGGFDFQLTSIDSDYVYVGMFASRNADITYTNVKLIIDGKEIGAVTPNPSPVVPTETPAGPTETPTATTATPTVKPSAPVQVAQVTNVKATENKTTSVKITWNKVKNATGYEVTYYKNNKAYKANVKGTSFKQTGLKAGKTLKYKVRAYRTVNGKKVYGKSSPTLTTTTAPGTTKITVSKVTSSSCKVSFKKVAGATGYRVQQYKNNKWVTIKTTKKTSVTVDKLKSATTVKLRAQAYRETAGKKVYGASSSSVKVTTVVGKPSLSLKKGTKKAYLSWKKVTKASGYDLYVSASKDKNFKRIQAKVTSKATKYTAIKLKSNKTYYFKMRAYQVVNGKKVYGDYSKVVGVKTK
ncbi:MAG: pectinesterase family protein [bacterium]|nr:pectinesterase family protein [bacterium]